MIDVCEITEVVHGGYGMCRVNGNVCFVPYALPGDEVVVEVVRQTRGVFWGEIREIVVPSFYRRKPACPVFGDCGGCTWLNFGYPGQGKWKRQIVTDCLERIGGIEMDCEWIEIPPLRLGYRTRAEFRHDSGRWGFLAKRSHRVIGIEACPLCHPRLNTAFAKLRSLSVDGPVEVTVNPEGDDVLVWTKRKSSTVEKVFPGAWYRDRSGRRPAFLFDGTPVVTGAFSQSSLLLQRTLVAAVTEMAGRADRILDIYCGSGALSLGLAAERQVSGIDHNRAAITAVSDLGLGDYRVGGDREIREVLGSGRWDAVMLDPPRTGAKTIIDAVSVCRTETVIYVSCDPATLARDLKAMAGKGWRVDRAVVIDMFPNTSHVETVCLLRQSSGSAR